MSDTHPTLSWLAEFFKSVLLTLAFVATFVTGAFLHEPVLKTLDAYVLPAVEKHVDVGYMPPTGSGPPHFPTLLAAGDTDHRTYPLWM